MTLTRNWIRPDPDLPLFTVPSGALEDFAVTAEPRKFWACYCAGPDLQHQQLFARTAATPIGPFGPELAVPLSGTSGAHVRLYRSRLGRYRRIVSQVWPGLPQIGLWLHSDIDSCLTARQLFIPPKAGTLYSAVAANPCALRRFADNSGPAWDIFFGGCAELAPGLPIDWRVFHATWDELRPPVVDDEPLFLGANPSALREGRRVYLYYSKQTPAGGFDTHVCWQDE